MNLKIFIAVLMKLTVSIIVVVVGSLVSSSSVPKSNHGTIYICCIGFNFDVIASGKWDLGFVKLTGAAAEAAAKEGKPLGEFQFAFSLLLFMLFRPPTLSSTYI